MYADLVQQLQENFPFADFAQQHGRRSSEVLEVFSAIVQLPLLRHSSDARSRISFAACKGRLRAARALQHSVKAIHRDEEHRAKRRKQLAAARKRARNDATRKQTEKQQKGIRHDAAPRSKGLLSDAISGGVGQAEVGSIDAPEVDG
jgi:hypothetical protein